MGGTPFTDKFCKQFFNIISNILDNVESVDIIDTVDIAGIVDIDDIVDPVDIICSVGTFGNDLGLCLRQSQKH